MTWRVIAFQYPQSDRIVCNSSAASTANRLPDFQYPQSDRIVCNAAKGNAAILRELTFSIRNRIELSATSTNHFLPSISDVFQYPQSDRIVCNARSAVPSFAPGKNFQYPQSDRIVCNLECNCIGK